MADHEGLGHATSLVSTAALTEVHMHRAFRLYRACERGEAGHPQV